MTLSQLIEHVGNQNVKFQRLDQCLLQSTTKKNGITKITFETDGITTNDLLFGGEKSKTTAFVLYIPTDKIPKL